KIAREQAPNAERHAVDEPILDAAETPHEQRRPTARQSVREQKIESLVARGTRDPTLRRFSRSRFHFGLHADGVTGARPIGDGAHCAAERDESKTTQISNGSRMLRASFESTNVWRAPHS